MGCVVLALFAARFENTGLLPEELQAYAEIYKARATDDYIAA